MRTRPQPVAGVIMGRIQPPAPELWAAGPPFYEFRTVRQRTSCRDGGVGGFHAPPPALPLPAQSEPVDDRHQSIDREPSEVRIADAREVRRLNPCAAVRGTHAQPLSGEGFGD